MQNINSKDTSLDTEALDKIEGEISELTKKLSEAKKQRNKLTAKTEIDFKISTIHKDRIGLILTKVMKVDRTQSYNKLKDQWRASAKAKDGWWLGEVKASGLKEKLVSVMHKIAKEGGTIIVDPVHKIDVPPANKWWDAEWEEQMEAEKANN